MPTITPLLLIISGPAGSGKTTLCERLLQTFPDQIQRVITSTSRKPRIGEINGRDYHFIPPEQFRAKIDAGDFVEHAFVHGRYYGTQRDDIIQGLNGSKDLILNIDVQGAQAFRADPNLKTLLPRAHSVFIRPQSLQQIEERLLKRGADDANEIKRRLNSAALEIQCADSFDHTILSNSRDEDFAALKSLYLKLANAKA